ncbi:monovalent cation/H(+) antiporter subunit G [Streptomyces sp. ACA25]|uniref:cation:proton antiporter n=1 Tax=Streptomyces sp. ACA25 TaxID=3022596 RepID=UPI0023074C30|nr:monovalent cation/H(+) antiporter subunit G [Streptomyces sp. ACA25]MDB1087724.1 monovalent cation/H(+) antiporter subunit G [Streptomyces sp. ACA25]
MTGSRVIADLLIVVGTLLIAVGALGLIRLPDAFSQVNAVTKGACLGVVCLLLGALIRMPSPSTTVTLIAAMVLQLITVPIAGYTVGRACYRSRARLSRSTHTDELGGRHTRNDPPS